MSEPEQKPRGFAMPTKSADELREMARLAEIEAGWTPPPEPTEADEMQQFGPPGEEH